MKIYEVRVPRGGRRSDEVVLNGHASVPFVSGVYGRSVRDSEVIGSDIKHQVGSPFGCVIHLPRLIRNYRVSGLGVIKVWQRSLAGDKRFIVAPALTMAT